MKVRLSHIAVACPDIAEVVRRLETLSLQVDETHEVPTEGVRAGMVPVEFSPHFRIELLEPTRQDSPIAKYLEKNPRGGMHHLCFEVTDLEKWLPVLEEAGFDVLAPGIRKAARGRALFIHPRSFGGILVELEEINS